MKRLLYLNILFCFLMIGCEKPKVKVSKPAEPLPRSDFYDIKLKNQSEKIVDTQLVVFNIKTDVKSEDLIEKVIDDGGNVKIVERNIDDGLNKKGYISPKTPEKVTTYFNTPMSSFAASVFNYQKKIEWSPKKRSDANMNGSPFISCVTLSDDKSVFAIAEVMGKEPGAKGTRLVLINTYNQDVLNLFVFENDLIIKMFFNPTEKALIALLASQESSKRDQRIIFYDLETMKIKKELPVTEKNISQIQYDPTHCLVVLKEENASNISIYDLEQKSRKVIACQAETTFFIESGAGNLVLTNNKYFEFIALENWVPLNKSENMIGKPFERFVFIDDDHYIVSTKEGKLYDIKDKNAVLITDDLKNDFILSSNQKTLSVRSQYNEEVTQWTGNPWKMSSKFSPRKLNPKNNYTIIYFNHLPVGNRILTFDSYGNLAYCVQSKIIWNKKIVISPK